MQRSALLELRVGRGASLQRGALPEQRVGFADWRLQYMGDDVVFSGALRVSSSAMTHAWFVETVRIDDIDFVTLDPSGDHGFARFVWGSNTWKRSSAIQDIKDARNSECARLALGEGACFGEAAQKFKAAESSYRKRLHQQKAQEAPYSGNDAQRCSKCSSRSGGSGDSSSSK